MKPLRPTSQQVAEHAGVSRTTVSFVLNNVAGSKISEDTKQRVLDAAKDLGYVPDAAARTLASGKTQTLGLVIPDSHHLEVDAFIPQVLFSLTEVCNQQGFRVIVEGLKASNPNPYQSLIAAKHIDGMVVLNPRSEDIDRNLFSNLIESGFPIVFIGSVHHPDEFNVIQPPLAGAAVKHLLDLGHTDIAHITYAPLSFQGARERCDIYQAAHHKAGLKTNAALIREGNYSAESGYLAMQSLLKSGEHFTALFAGNDTIALGAMAALHQAKLRIPEDVAIVGHDDIPMAAYGISPLSTIHTSPKEQGRCAGELLIDLVKGQPPSQQSVQVSDAKLIIRESCGQTLKNQAKPN